MEAEVRGCVEGKERQRVNTNTEEEEVGKGQCKG